MSSLNSLLLAIPLPLRPTETATELVGGIFVFVRSQLAQDSQSPVQVKGVAQTQAIEEDIGQLVCHSGSFSQVPYSGPSLLCGKPLEAPYELRRLDGDRDG